MKKLLPNRFLRGIIYGVILAIMGYFMLYIDPPTKYEITEQYTIKAQEKLMIALAILVPKTMDYQQISNLKIEGGKKVFIQDTARLQVVIVEPQEVKDTIIILTYDVYLPKGAISWHGIPTLNDLSPQQFIESDNTELITKSRSIASGQTTEDARKLYDFVSTWLKWPSGDRINATTSALIAYQKKVGGCNDFAQLLTAMLRANGIPARSISGLALPQLVNFKNP